MTGLDIVILAIALVFVIVGAVKGFIKTLLRLGAAVFAIIVARMFGYLLGEALFGDLLSRRSPLAENMSPATLRSVNVSLSTLLGGLIIFLAVYILLRIIIRLTAKRLTDSFCGGLIDRLLGACLGLLLALGAIYALACVIDLLAIVLSICGSSFDIYDAVESSTLFKYFF